MATKSYTLDDFPVESGDISITDPTGLLSNYETLYTITPTLDVKYWIRNASSPTATSWENVEGFTSSGKTISANNETSIRVEAGGYHRLYFVPVNSGDSGTVEVSISAESFAPTYCLPSDVASLLGISDFDADSTPTHEQVIAWILAAEDEIDERTDHAWRAVMVSNEYHDYEHPVFTSTRIRRSERRFVSLRHRSIRSLTSGSHTIEVFDGSDWVDYVSTKTEGRNDDYWVNYTDGIIHFKDSFPYYEVESVRCTYEYGESSVPKGIRDACAKLVALKVLMTDDYSAVFPEGFRGLTQKDKYDLWKSEVDSLLEQYMEIPKGLL